MCRLQPKESQNHCFQSLLQSDGCTLDLIHLVAHINKQKGCFNSSMIN